MFSVSALDFCAQHVVVLLLCNASQQVIHTRALLRYWPSTVTLFVWHHRLCAILSYGINGL